MVYVYTSNSEDVRVLEEVLFLLGVLVVVQSGLALELEHGVALVREQVLGLGVRVVVQEVGVLREETEGLLSVDVDAELLLEVKQTR